MSLTKVTYDMTTLNEVLNITGTSKSYNYCANPQLNSIAAGKANVIAGGGYAAFVNTITGATDYQTISGGYDNNIDGCIASTISGGAHHRVVSGTTHGTIGGGSYSTISGGDYCTIAGGTGHTVSADNGTVGGGTNNHAGQDATVAGGSTNTALGRYATIAGGTLCNAASQSASVGGGDNNDIDAGLNARIGGGYQNKIGVTSSYTGNASTIGGGYQNLIGQTANADYGVISGGRGNSLAANYATVLGGYGNTVTAVYGQASGLNANARLYGANARSVRGATYGQKIDLELSRITTDATVSELLLDGSTQYLYIPDNTVWAIKGVVAATRTDVVGGYAMYTVECLVTRGAGAATTQMVGLTINTVYETTAAWALSGSISTSNGQVRFRPTGEVGKTIRWMCNLQITEVMSA